MASNSEILKEYLVALGFKVDQNSLNKMDAALGKTTKAALGFAAILIGTATAATAFVDKVSAKMSDLYWSTVRLRDGAANIQDFKLQISQLGGDADSALSSLENMATFLRTNPAGEGILHQLGVQTRDAKGNLRSTIDIVKDFAHLPIPYWLKVKWGSTFGISEKDLQAIDRMQAGVHQVGDQYARAGINADQAAKASAEFHNKMLAIEGTAGVLATVLEVHLLPTVTLFVDLLSTVAGWILDLDNLTGGFTTDLIALTGAIWGVNLAMRAAFGAGVVQLITGLILQVGVLAEALGASEGVVGAIVAIGAAIEATPIGWIITGIALLGAAAFFVIAHWDKVKQYFNSFVGWLREKYNTMAKYLGLPQWTGGGAGGGGGADGGMPDYKNNERNRGPWSMPGQEGAPDQGASAAVTGKALAFFQKAGWSAQQAAGIVANLIHESALNPSAVGDHGAAVGVAQWHPDRQAAFKQWAGKDVRDATMEEQLAFVQQELTHGARQFAGKMLAGATNAAQAGAIVSRYYEAPDDATGAKAAQRGATAEQLLNGSKLAPSGGRGATQVSITQKTDIQVSGSDPDSTARAVGREQGRVNGDLVRNFAGAST